MAPKKICTFIINGNVYDLIGMSGDNLLWSEQFGTLPAELPVAHHATYELTPDALYLRSLTIKEDNVRYLPVKAKEPQGVFSQNTYQGLSTAVPFTGKIRLGKGFRKEPFINMGYQKAVAFETVLDITIKNGRVTEVMDRSWEMEQKRYALQKCYESRKRLEGMGYQKSMVSKMFPRMAMHDGRPVAQAADGPREIEYCALREYHECAQRLEKTLNAFGLDTDLE